MINITMSKDEAEEVLQALQNEHDYEELEQWRRKHLRNTIRNIMEQLGYEDVSQYEDWRYKK